MRGLGLVAAVLVACVACTGAPDARVHLRVAGSAVGAEGEILALQLARFERAHPGVVKDVHEAGLPNRLSRLTAQNSTVGPRRVARNG